MDLQRYWLREQPAGSWIDSIHPWSQIKEEGSPNNYSYRKDRPMFAENMGQCMAGAVDRSGTPVQKRTQWAANSETLLAPMRKFKCDYNHYHGSPTGKGLSEMKVYPWKLCEAVISGVAK